MVRLVSGLVVSLLVVPTLAVTAARVLPGDSLPWVILRACAPLAIISYGLAVIVLVGSTWGLAFRSLGVAALVVVTSLLCLHVWWFTEPFFLAGPPGEPSGDTLTVMTANLHIGQADPDAVLRAVARHGVDVLVLQEITPAALDGLDRAGLDRRLGHRAGAPGQGRDGIVVLANKPLRDIGEIDTSSAGYEIEMTTSRGPLRILAVHPTAPNNGVAQWSGDLDVVVAAARASRGPTLVAGDFNATLDHPPLQALMDASFRDASADAGPSWRPTWPSPGNVQLAGTGVPSLFALDHVFLRGALEAVRARTLVVAGTDHRALVTRISWTG